MTQKSSSRLEFWITYFLYMLGFFLVLLCADATINGKWEDIMLNLGLTDVNSVYDKKFSASNTKSVSTDASVAPAKTEKPLDALTPDLIARLQKGGYSLFFRHSHRDNPQSMREFDRAALVKDVVLLPPFEKGVCLTDIGRSEARLIGEVFRHHAIPVGKIYTSPICRAIETAYYAFDRVDFTTAGLSLDQPLNEDEQNQRVEIGKKIVLAAPAPGTNKVLAAHTAVLGKMIPFEGRLPQSGLAVIEHVDQTTARVIAVLTLQALADSLAVDFSLNPYHHPLTSASTTP